MAQLITVDKPGPWVVAQATWFLQGAGLQVIPSFSLRAALAAGIPCTCPHHEDACDCDMAVLLVYGADPGPVTLVAHSHDGRTWLSLPGDLVERPDPELARQIRAVLAECAVATETPATG